MMIELFAPIGAAFVTFWITRGAVFLMGRVGRAMRRAWQNRTRAIAERTESRLDIAFARLDTIEREIPRAINIDNSKHTNNHHEHSVMLEEVFDRLHEIECYTLTQLESTSAREVAQSAEKYSAYLKKKRNNIN